MNRPAFALFFALVTAQAAAQLPTLQLKTGTDREIYRTMVRRLQGTRLSVDWEEIALRDAIRHIGRNVRINMVILGAVRERADEPVSLKLKDVSAMTILKVLRSRCEVEFQHRHGVLVVTTQADALEKSMVLVLHGIHEILYTPPDFPAKARLGLSGSGSRGDEEAKEESREPRFDPDYVVDLVRSSTGGDKVWDARGASISHHKGKLIVRHAPHIQSRVRQILRALR